MTRERLHSSVIVMRMEKDILEEIRQKKKEKNAVILAHYYVNDELQAIPFILQKRRQGQRLMWLCSAASPLWERASSS